MVAGRVGRPHGLDGGFYVTGALPRLLGPGTPLTLGALATRVLERRGTDTRPILRVEGVNDRAGAEALRGSQLTVAADDAPALADGEWWASELEGCTVFDGERRVGEVSGLLELPSCEALEVRPAGTFEESAGRSAGGREPEGGERLPEPLLIPMVRDAIRSVDIGARRIDVDMGFLAG